MARLFLLLFCYPMVFTCCRGHITHYSGAGDNKIFPSHDHLLNLFQNDQLVDLQYEISRQLGDAPTLKEWTEILSTLKYDRPQPQYVWKPNYQFLFGGAGYVKHPTGDINLAKRTYATFEDSGKTLNTISVTFFSGRANETSSSPEEMVGATGIFAKYVFAKVTPNTVSVEFITKSTTFLEDGGSYTIFGSKLTGSKSTTFKILDSTFSMTKKFFSIEETAMFGVTKRKGERNLIGLSFGKDLPHFVNGTDAISDSMTGNFVTSRITGSLPNAGNGHYALYSHSNVGNELSGGSNFLEMAVHGYCNFPHSMNTHFIPEMLVD